MRFKIVVAPNRDTPRIRSPLVREFVEAVKCLKRGQALQVSAVQIGWRADTKMLACRVHHACSTRGVKVCTETQKDGTVKVWRQRPSVGEAGGTRK